MSAGTGVTHSEFNASPHAPLHFLQMWIHPRVRSTLPRYEQKAFSAAERRGRLRLVVSPDGADGSLTIGQDARLYAALLARNDQVQHDLPPDRCAWLHVARGSVSLNGEALSPGDGAAIGPGTQLLLRGVEDAELVLWDLPAVVDGR